MVNYKKNKICEKCKLKNNNDITNNDIDISQCKYCNDIKKNNYFYDNNCCLDCALYNSMKSMKLNYDEFLIFKNLGYGSDKVNYNVGNNLYELLLKKFLK